MPNYRAVSLFSNCGAGDLGYRKAGFQFQVMAELDERRLSVSLLNHPEAVGVPGDLRTTWPKVIQEYRAKFGGLQPHLLCACPPCQGMSSARAGKGAHHDAAAGSKDSRNLLVTVVARVALELKPNLLVVENVPAFLTRRVHHPDDAQPISAANLLVSALGDEYLPYAMVTDLADFAVPQSRKRAFLTFVRRDLPVVARLTRRELLPFPRPSYGQGGRRYRHLSEVLRSFDLPELDASNEAAAASPRFKGLHTVPVWDERTYAMVSSIPPGSGASAWENDECPACKHMNPSENRAVCERCASPLLRPVVREKTGAYRLVKGFRSSYRRMHADRPAATVTTASGHVGSDFTIHPSQNRLLSPLECALLQTFPRSFKWGDALERWGHSNVREMIGEAVPPAFTEKHGKILIELLRGTTSSSMAASDPRADKAWKKLARAALKDGRPDPRQWQAGSDQQTPNRKQA